MARRFPRFCEWLSLVVAREHLFLGDWSTARQAARRCLVLATDETIRDEAQNLLACALHNAGDHAGALRELQTAIEGEYSVALLANIGVVAAHLDPELAAGHLARIVREAPTLAMRVNAAGQALHTWQTDSTNIWRGEDPDRQQLPAVLRQPLRSVLLEPIDLDDFRAIASVLALHDSQWLATPESLRSSPHRDSLEARYFRARALASQDMFATTVDVLGTVQDWEQAPEWITAARGNLVRQTIEFLFDHLDDPDNTAGLIAHALVEKVTGLPARERVVLALLAVATLTYHLSEQDLEIAESLVTLFRQARAEAATLDRELAGPLDQLVELATRRIALNLHQARARELDAQINSYNVAIATLARVPPGTSLWLTARRVVAELIDSCQRAREQLGPWLRLVEHADLREMLTDLMEHTRDIELKARRVLDR